MLFQVINKIFRRIKKIEQAKERTGKSLILVCGNVGDGKSHATLVVEGGKNALIACHSSNHYGIDYNYMKNSKPYYNWLHINA